MKHLPGYSHSAFKVGTLEMRVLVILFCFWGIVNGAPLMMPMPVSVISMSYPPFDSPYRPGQRLFWSQVGNWISGSDWFPIEVNVPDVVNNVVSGVSGIVGNNVQRIPIINRLTSAVQPRPLQQQYMLVPVERDQIPYFVYP